MALHFEFKRNYVKCAFCKYQGNRQSMHRHLRQKHAARFPPGVEIIAPHHTIVDYEQPEYTIEADRCRLKKFKRPDNSIIERLQIRIQWNHDNPDMPEDSTATFHNIEDALEVDTLHEAIAKSLSLPNYIKPGKEAVKFIKKLQHGTANCAVCLKEDEPLTEFCVFVKDATADATSSFCHEDIKHVICEDCFYRFDEDGKKSCAYCRSTGEYKKIPTFEL